MNNTHKIIRSMPFRHLGIKLLLGLVGLTVFLGSGSAAKGALWTYEWNAVTETPESKGLTFSNGTNPNTPTANGLIIPDTGYYSGAFDGNATTGWTLAVRVERVDTSSDFGSFLSIFDGSSEVDFDYFSNSYYRLSTDSGNSYIAPPDSNNQQFVNIQIAKIGDAVSIYYNGNDIPVFTYTSVASGVAPEILLGNSSVGSPVSEVTYLNYTNQGAFTPSEVVPEPSTYALLGLGLLTGFVVVAKGRHLEYR